jgi:cytosine/uracil/thiamine/allantoin permease
MARILWIVPLLIAGVLYWALCRVCPKVQEWEDDEDF